MRALYARSRLFQWIVAFAFFGVFLALHGAVTLGAAILLGLQIDNPLHLSAAVGAHVAVLLPLWMMLGSLFFTPLLRHIGALRYCSPYLVVTRGGHGRIDLHGATLFDYLILFCWSDRGRPAVRKILLWYIDGLLALASEIREGRLPDNTVLSATSYIFSESIARRYGFSVEQASRFSFGGLLTYPTQFLTYTFAKGRWAFPPIFRARRATISGAQLCSQTARLQRLRDHLHSADV